MNENENDIAFTATPTLENAAFAILLGRTRIAEDLSDSRMVTVYALDGEQYFFVRAELDAALEMLR